MITTMIGLTSFTPKAFVMECDILCNDRFRAGLSRPCGLSTSARSARGGEWILNM